MLFDHLRCTIPVKLNVEIDTVGGGCDRDRQAMRASHRRSVEQLAGKFALKHCGGAHERQPAFEFRRF